jgi:hypothetical protein
VPSVSSTLPSLHIVEPLGIINPSVSSTSSVAMAHPSGGVQLAGGNDGDGVYHGSIGVGVVGVGVVGVGVVGVGVDDGADVHCILAVADPPSGLESENIYSPVETFDISKSHWKLVGDVTLLFVASLPVLLPSRMRAMAPDL